LRGSRAIGAAPSFCSAPLRGERIAAWARQNLDAIAQAVGDLIESEIPALRVPPDYDPNQGRT
jgi:hypothetical protein